jgi:hypothetical protein
MTSEMFAWVWLPGAVEPVVCGRLYSTGERVEFVYGRSFRTRERSIPLMPAPMRPRRFPMRRWRSYLQRPKRSNALSRYLLISSMRWSTERRSAEPDRKQRFATGKDR